MKFRGFAVAFLVGLFSLVGFEFSHAQSVDDVAPAAPAETGPTFDPHVPPADSVVTDWMRSRLTGVAPQLQSRYRHHHGEWWFQLNDGGWKYHRDGQWRMYDSATYKPAYAPQAAPVVEFREGITHPGAGQGVIVHHGYANPRVLGYRGSHVPAETRSDYRNNHYGQPDSRGTFYRSDINVNGFYGFPARREPWYPRYGF